MFFILEVMKALSIYLKLKVYNILLFFFLILNYSNYKFYLLNIKKDPFEKRAIKAQINEFGQTPKQIFSEPHVTRRTKMMRVKDLPLKTNSNIKKNNEKKILKIKNNEVSNQKNKIEISNEKVNIKKKENTKTSSRNIKNNSEKEKTKKSSILSHENRIEELLRRDTMDFMDLGDQIIKEIKRTPSDPMRRNSDSLYNYVRSKKYKFETGISKTPNFIQLGKTSNLNFTSNFEELLFIDKSENVYIVDTETFSAQKTLKVTEARIQTAEKLSEHHFLFGCSHGKISLYNDSYASLKQSFEAHDHSITNLLVSPNRVKI